VSGSTEESQSAASRATTRGIVVEVESRYVPERSDPKHARWYFAYRVRITNQGSERVQLLSRHWLIADAHGRVEEVKGPGVVGEQPILEPSEAFEYTSFCPLGTAFGSMRGTYRMITAHGEEFDAEIAAFALAEPFAVN
jgi:ApaG protein